jgi:hypothetical protein
VERSPAATPSLYPFGLSNAATTYASAYAFTHAEPLGRHQHFALDLIVTTSTHTHTDSSEEDEAWARADFSGLRDPEAMRRFLAASDYCFGYSDSDDEGTYDPTRECFHVELGMPSTGDEDEGAGSRSPPLEGAGGAAPPHVEPRAARNENLAPEELRCLDLEQLCELQAKVEQD